MVTLSVWDFSICRSVAAPLHFNDDNFANPLIK